VRDGDAEGRGGGRVPFRSGLTPAGLASTQSPGQSRDEDGREKVGGMGKSRHSRIDTPPRLQYDTVTLRRREAPAAAETWTRQG